MRIVRKWLVAFFKKVSCQKTRFRALGHAFGLSAWSSPIHNTAQLHNGTAEDQGLSEDPPLPKGGLCRFLMLQTLFNWVRLTYYRYTVCTGLYMLGNVEVTIIHLIFAVSSYYLLIYAYAFITQLTQLGTPSN